VKKSSSSAIMRIGSRSCRTAVKAIQAKVVSNSAARVQRRRIATATTATERATTSAALSMRGWAPCGPTRIAMIAGTASTRASTRSASTGCRRTARHIRDSRTSSSSMTITVRAAVPAQRRPGAVTK
jgi:hypothetical protein